ncbi:MAG: ABC transporter ATP-binding protein [Hyphomicrobiaceae bacterium]
MSATMLKIDNVTLGYEGHPAVHHLSGVIGQGALLAVCGPNGSGKSTLLKGIAGLLKPFDGAILRPGCRTRDIAYLPQQAEIDRHFPATVIDVLTLGLIERRGLFGSIGKADTARMLEALQTVGLSGFEMRPVETLSGGQLQRVLFARVLLQDARVILLDEPFNAIDARTVSDLVALIHRWHGEKRTVVAVLHDMTLIREQFPETLLLAREAIAWGDTAKVLAPENIIKARRMTEAWDDHAPWCEDVKVA